MREAKNHVINAAGDHARHGRNQQRSVLIIGMNHDHDVGAGGKSLAVAGLLVASIAVIGVVDEGPHAKWRERVAVWSLLESSTRILISTTSDNSRTVFSRVFSAL